MLERGGIYLAKLYHSKGAEPGKTRPVLVLQDDALNEVGHETVIILPLTTNLIDDAFPLRMRILKRDLLKQDSDVLCDQVRAIDTKRVIQDKLAVVNKNELYEIEQMVQLILGIS
ncbi:type II toxin-antitoxin system PemK/MazF family toxin [Sulfurimonas lithotrophica]|uniref:mRNA interferase n=1 Tax=Sulfurimonas lithotrophica TaxID=2590022 RepID=A0A5P8P249_9BACT|nr:type II toxin-antitoxin system PemK/MazF family toxin [Sulfurimonas lithotrophica]QFR49701.1 type II toxin-antitoxin system PemK/MazF family toxin [Sulfurimonas lithotrophica]